MDTSEQLRKPVWTPASARRVCLVVLGMHRSGTSALARVLGIAGAGLPTDLLGATAANQKGHWESSRLVEYHDQILAEFGTAWNDWRPIDTSRIPLSRRAEIKSELAELINGQFGDSPLVVLKDPRVCRFGPLLLEALEAAGFDSRCILPFRSPLEVAESLERRDQIARSRAGLLWLRHVLDAELASRGRPRAFVSYDSLLAGWELTLSRLASEVSVEWPYHPSEIKDQIESFLSPDLRNHRSSIEDVLLDPMLRGWTSEVYSALLVLEKSPKSATALTVIDRVRREFDGATPVIGRLLTEADAALAEARRGEAAANTALKDLQEAHAELALDLEARKAATDAMSAKVAQVRDANAQLAADAATREALLNQLRQDLARASQALVEGEALRAVLQDREAELAKLEKALADANHRAAADARDRAAELASVQNALTEAESALAGLRDREAELVRAVETLSARPTDFRDAVILPFVQWLLDDEFDNNLVDLEKVVDWLAPTFRSHSGGDRWHINAHGADMAELMKLLKQTPDAQAGAVREGAKTKELLLVSEYAPSFAHAGGLRLRDLYVEIRRLNPDSRLTVYCPQAPEIDGDITWLAEIFDEVYLTKPADFAFVDFVQKSGGVRRYDVVDCQFHRAGRLLAQFSRIAERTLFTPMECLSRSHYEQTRAGLRRDKEIRVKDVVALLHSTLDELRVVSAADETVCVSDADAAFLRKLVPWRRVDSVPTGLSDSEFGEQLSPSYQPAPPSAKSKRLVYAAYFGSDTNRVGLAWYLDHVHPHVLRHCPDYKLAVVGRGDLTAFIQRQPEGVTFIGEVPVMPPVLQQARAGLVFALHGSGFRGKINQYAACGLPSVSTALGATGLAYTAGEDILIADDPHEFALACVRLLKDDQFADEIAVKARATALRNYRWEESHEKIRQIYRL